MNTKPTQAPELMVREWLNTPAPITLAAQRGKVVVIEAFQMLCPGCVSHGLPQAQQIADTFSAEDITVVGLHSVFEHHEAQGTRAALAAFLHEYRIRFPVAIDEPSGGNVPRTMAAYQLRGTPSLVLIDRMGRVRQQHFGQVSDMVVGAQVTALLGENQPAVSGVVPGAESAGGCDEHGCRISPEQDTGPRPAVTS